MANNCKYYKQQRQVSYDEGETWVNVVPEEYQMGDLIGESSDCIDTSLTRWQLVPGDYICVGKDKYEKEVGQYSNDDGVTWNNMYPTTFREGRLIESNSTVCNNKWEGHYYTPDSVRCGSGYTYVYGVGCVRNSSGGGGGGSLYFRYRDPIKFVRCEQSTSTTLTSYDVSYSPYRLLYGTIGECVTSITASFTGDEIESITLLPENPPLLSGSGTFGTGNYPIYVPCDSLSLYKAYWAEYADRIQTEPGCDTPPPVTVYKLQATYGDGTTDTAVCSGGSSVSSSDVKSGSSIVTATIGDCALYVDDFSYCYSLTSVTMSDIVTNILGMAFAYCRNLTNITIGNNVETIGDKAFMGCSTLPYIEIPDSVTSIGFNCFGGCFDLEEIRIGSGLTELDKDAFYNCSGLTSITIYAPTPPTTDWTYPSDSPFYGCTSLNTIYVPAESIGLYRSKHFWNDYNIQPIT